MTERTNPRTRPLGAARSLVLLAASIVVASGGSARAFGSPIDNVQLFMDPVRDTTRAWGLLEGNPNALQLNGTLNIPPRNYSAGATVFASFAIEGTNTFEVFVASGRPGEPLLGDMAHHTTRGGTPWDTGVSVDRFTTADFVTYSAPMQGDE